MSFNNIFLFLLISCICSVTALVQSKIEPEKLEDIRNYLKKINKPAVKTIKSPDGDFIDCVLFDQQPAFDHPLLQGHKKKTDLPALPKGFLSENNNTFDEEVFQLWRMSGETCPKNTIPIRRTTEEDVLRASSLQTFGRKRASRNNNNNNNNNNNTIVNSNKYINQVHEHAIVFGSDDNYYGANAIINVWLPKVERKPEFSLAQIWVIGRRSDGALLETIEAGYIVNYGDKRPRLFVYWTSDGYQNSGCYDLLCPGFVQVCGNNDVAPGAAFNNPSTYNGKQRVIRVTVWKAPENGNWWLAFNGKQVGYWPSSLFKHLRYHADTVEFGGEIVNSGGQTMTQMGSGHFCTKQKQRFGRTAYLRNLQMINSNNQLFTPNKLDTFIENPDRYSAQMAKGEIWGKCMYYGGPGKDDPGCT